MGKKSCLVIILVVAACGSSAAMIINLPVEKPFRGAYLKAKRTEFKIQNGKKTIDYIAMERKAVGFLSLYLERHPRILSYRGKKTPLRPVTFTLAKTSNGKERPARRVDLYSSWSGRAREIKNSPAVKVDVSATVRLEVEADALLHKKLGKAYVPEWHFLGMGPAPRLEALLFKHRITWYLYR